MSHYSNNLSESVLVVLPFLGTFPHLPVICFPRFIFDETHVAKLVYEIGLA